MRPVFKLKMRSSSSLSVGSVGAPCSTDELVDSQGNVMIQNDVASPTLNTNEASRGIATVEIAFQPDPSLQLEARTERVRTLDMKSFRGRRRLVQIPGSESREISLKMCSPFMQGLSQFVLFRAVKAGRMF